MRHNRLPICKGHPYEEGYQKKIIIIFNLIFFIIFCIQFQLTNHYPTIFINDNYISDDEVMIIVTHTVFFSLFKFLNNLSHEIMEYSRNSFDFEDSFNIEIPKLGGTKESALPY